MGKGIQVSAMSESVGLKLYINIIRKPQNALIPMDTAFLSLCQIIETIQDKEACSSATQL